MDTDEALLNFFQSKRECLKPLFSDLLEKLTQRQKFLHTCCFWMVALAALLQCLHSWWNEVRIFEGSSAFLLGLSSLTGMNTNTTFLV